MQHCTAILAAAELLFEVLIVIIFLMNKSVV